eukprot:5018228-Pleurochrysis_carterae.AAC.1
MHSSQNWARVACVLSERFALRSPSSWIPRARDGCRCPVSPFLEPPRRCAPASAPTPAPDQWSLVSYTNNHFPARPGW